jgi:magnesium chelatase family protein
MFQLAIEGEGNMVARVSTLAFEGVETRPVDVQIQIASGTVAFMIVGLGDKAVGESRERVRAALIASGLALPAKRITVNLAPADLPKEGSHYDLPIALGVMAAIGAIPADALDGYAVIGELALDGGVSAVAGVLPAAMAANGRGLGLICPAACGPEAAWASADLDILAPRSLIQLANHFRGVQVLSRPAPAIRAHRAPQPDLREIKGQESAKRALEIAAAGGHNLLMSGAPGAGKSMLAQRLPSILPPLAPRELLEVSMIHSVAGHLAGGALTDRRPFRAPHHSASMAALVGGGPRAKPGEISLAHHGVLFLDELPEFQSQTLDSLRQPIETGEVSIARANHRIVYPARFQLIVAMNPCRCGHADEPGYACARGQTSRCAAQYQNRLSGPLLDRFDLTIHVPSVSAADLLRPAPAEGSAEVAQRVAAAREIQRERYRGLGLDHVGCNAAAPASVVEAVAAPDASAMALLREATERSRVSARGYHRVLKLARTLADLDGEISVRRAHLAEALSYRGPSERAAAA